MFRMNPKEKNTTDEFICDQSMCSEAQENAFSPRENLVVPCLNAIYHPKHKCHFIMHMNNIIFQLGAYVLKSKSELVCMLTVT